MTNREFIQQQMRAFGVTESDLMFVDLNPDDEVTDVSVTEKAMIPLLAKLALSPYQKSINENGFSVAWDVSKMGWLYKYLCSKYGITPDPQVLAAFGMSVIIDQTKKW